MISWLGVIASFNVVFLLMGVLNGLATYGLARRAMGAGRWEAWLAGLAFAWSPVLIARSTGHFSLVAAAPLPAFLWALINAERSRSFRDAALVGRVHGVGGVLRRVLRRLLPDDRGAVHRRDDPAAGPRRGAGPADVDGG